VGYDTANQSNSK